MRSLRRLLAPAAVVVAALALGLLVWSPASKPAATPGLSGSVLTAATSSNNSAQQSEGKTLFDESCSSCHGINAQGSALGPNLRGVGSGTVDLWVSSGWMPLANPTQQPARKPPLFNRQQTIAIADYVASLSSSKGFPIPNVSLKGANVSQGMSIFAENCAPCHTITGAGDALSGGINAPPLHGVTETQIAEAVRTGPGNMPRFGPGTLSNSQVRDVIAYVTRYIEHPVNPGGNGLGGVGPVAEGFIGLFVGVGLCVLVAFWIGDRTPRSPEGAEEHGGDGPEGGSGGDGSDPGGDGSASQREVEHV
ncbi:MAG: cytochrome c class [Acidimicrobiaceae bacterium]|nr:cytochrome c class [Acidimicrobiaceae bacterium]